MHTKTILVTGANRGIGKATAAKLAAEGCDLILAYRSLGVGEASADALRRTGALGRISAAELDLSSLESIRHFARVVEDSGQPIDALINNAGVLADHFELTADGFELSMAVNYLGPFLLTRLLLPSMAAQGGRIINTSSSAFRIGRLTNGFGPDLARAWHPIRAYANSKLALLISSVELAQRLSGSGIGVFATDPGIVNTDMIKLNQWFDPLTDALFRPLIQTGDQGARASVSISLASDSEYSSGRYYGNRGPIPLPRRVLRSQNRAALWQATEKALGLECENNGDST